MSHPAAAPGGQSRPVLAVGIVGYVIWGLIPAWFILAGRMGAGSWEIVGQRALWSAPWAASLVLISGHFDQVRRVFRSPRLLAQLAVSALMIVSGWSVYVWAVNNGRNIESSLGYFINPLLNMAVGAWLFRERIDGVGLAAIGLAAVGVLLQTFALGHPPLIALFLAVTFTIYGVIRKRIEVDAQAGLLVESVLMFPFGLALTLWVAHAGTATFGRHLPITLVLLAMGPATVLPLALFAWTARRMPLTSVAFLQFTGPTLGFAIGLVMGERLSPVGVVSFGFIWAGVLVFLLGAWRRVRRLAGVRAAPAAQASEA
ncbi:MAG TPA: EamA family transporter RarD [Caulobacteraceae bacterium]|nr:EamA family transporter RarD [Caulobacteraceae bacterium]